VKFGIPGGAAASRPGKRAKPPAAVSQEVFTPHDAGLVTEARERRWGGGMGAGAGTSAEPSGELSKLVEKSAPFVNLPPVITMPPSNIPPGVLVAAVVVNEAETQDPKTQKASKIKGEAIMAWRATLEETTLEALPVMLDAVASLEETAVEAPPVNWDEVASFQEQSLAPMHTSISSASSETNISEEELEDESSICAGLEITKNVKELTLKSNMNEKSSSTQRVDSGSSSTAPVTIKTRAYQQEMFEESLKRNIIVCVSTIPSAFH